MAKMSITASDTELHHIDAAGYRIAAGRWPARAQTANRPILFLGGFGGCMASADPFLSAFDDRDTIGFDVPGLGKSPDAAMPYTPLMMADVAAAVLDHFDVTAADVVGLSWGGLLAQQLALQHGARVNRLVLAATAAGMVMVPPDLSQWTQGAGPDGIDRGILQRWITTAADWQQGVWDQMKRQHPRIGPGMMHQSLAFAGWSSAPWLPLFLTMPTLILANRHDPIVPMPNADLLHALIPGSRLETVDSGGHFFLLSEIDTVRARIIAFLDG